MTNLHVTLVSDGPSDRVLLHPIAWLLSRHLRRDIAVQRQWADFRALRRRPKDLADRISLAAELYPAHILFVHRDAEREEPDVRYMEIARARAEANVQMAVVPLVPVRMTEAWLLFDESAIRRASGNPNGGRRLSIPDANPESLPDPKDHLREAIRAASGLSGRRLTKLNPLRAIYRVAEYIDDFSPLLALPSFRRLDEAVGRVLHDRGWT